MNTLKTYTIGILGAIVLLIGSCRPKEIPIAIPKAESKMALASQVIPNSTMFIALSRSFDALTNTDTSAGQDLLDQILVAHARVTVTYNGKTDTLFRVAPGIYGTITTPLLDEITYTLEAFDSTSGKQISASTRMKKRIFIDTAFITNTTSAFKDTLRQLNLAFTDMPGEDYYMVNIYRNTQFIKSGFLDPAAIFNLGNNSDVRTIAISDQTFGNLQHKEVIDLPNFYKNDTLTLTVSHIERDYYTYLVQKQRSAQNGLGNFFGEPVNFITNVNGGYGFFTAYWPDARIMIVKE